MVSTNFGMVENMGTGSGLHSSSYTDNFPIPDLVLPQASQQIVWVAHVTSLQTLLYRYLYNVCNDVTCATHTICWDACGFTRLKSRNLLHCWIWSFHILLYLSHNSCLIAWTRLLISLDWSSWLFNDSKLHMLNKTSENFTPWYLDLMHHCAAFPTNWFLNSRLFILNQYLITKVKICIIHWQSSQFS